LGLKVDEKAEERVNHVVQVEETVDCERMENAGGNLKLMSCCSERDEMVSSLILDERVESERYWPAMKITSFD
jgi:hypothetical protein